MDDEQRSRQYWNIKINLNLNPTTLPDQVLNTTEKLPIALCHVIFSVGMIRTTK